MKILLLNQTFWPDHTATAQYLTDLAEDMVCAGHEVSVLAARKSYLDPDKTYPVFERCQGISIVRVWPFSFGKQNKFLRILDAGLVNFAFAWKLLWIGKFDVIAALTTPPLVGVIAALFAKLRQSRLVLWVMDLNPDQAIEYGLLKRESFRAKFLDWILKKAFAASSAIVVLDAYMRERILKKGDWAHKMHIVPIWTEQNMPLITHSGNPFRKKFRLENKFVVMYSGNHSLCHPLDTVLSAAEKLRGDSDILFLFIGGGERVREVTQFKEAKKLTNIIQLPYQKREDLRYSLPAADIHLVTMGSSFVGIVHPSKIYGILQSGRPFIYVGPRQSAIGELVSEKGVGCWVNHGETEKITEAIYRFKAMTDEAKLAYAGKSHDLAESQFGRKSNTEKLIGVITGKKEVG